MIEFAKQKYGCAKMDFEVLDIEMSMIALFIRTDLVKYFVFLLSLGA